MGRLILDRSAGRRQLDMIVPGLGTIEVYVVDWYRGGVRLAITAPPEITVLRHELTEGDRQP